MEKNPVTGYQPAPDVAAPVWDAPSYEPTSLVATTASRGDLRSQDRPRPAAGRIRKRLRRVLGDTTYLLTAFPLVVTAFVVLTTLLSSSLALLLLVVGIPLLALSLLAARGFASVERWLVERCVGRQMSSPRYPHRAGGLSGFLDAVKDPQSWLDVLWAFVSFPVSMVTFSLTVLWSVSTAMFPFVPLLHLVAPDWSYQGLGSLLSLNDPFASYLFDQVFTLAFAVTMPWVVPALARLQSGLSHALLSSRAGMEEQIGDLREARDAARQAETTQLRRLERDIHDGPQQRLIRLQVDLARAERIAERDPERAKNLLAEARATAQETLAELRQLSRGIAPPVLVDRGFDAAVDEAAARSEVPVTVQTAATGVPDHVATAAYFVVAESLTNLNKHSGATTATVTAAAEGGMFVVTVTDDGIGGASVAKGHGLAGLAERLRGLDGTLEVSSPVGGPTVVQAVIPCGS